MIRVLNCFKEHDVEYKRNFKLSSLSSVKTGGIADFAAFPKKRAEFISLINFCEDCNIKYKIVGNATNILFSDEGFHGIVIFTKRLSEISCAGALSLADCGASLASVIYRMARNNYGGMEALSGIPASVGGAVFNNAGAYGDDISNSLLFAELYSLEDRKFIVADNSKLMLSYRKSVLQKGKYILLSACFAFIGRSESEVLTNMRKYREKRRAAQPHAYPSLGSVFKRHEGFPVARAIDELGLKGRIIGGAQISEKHAGFIINRGGASSRDIKDLIALVKKDVYASYGFLPEEEIEILN